MLKNGDMLYLYHEKVNFMIPFQENGSFSCHKGNIKFEAGMDYGDVVVSTTGEEFHILRPSLSDWMMKVRRDTTIIYPKEAGTILLELGIENGSTVIEVGSGSGSLTVLMSRLVGTNGKIYSYERDPEHQERAKKNLARLGNPDVVEFILKDPAVDEEGFAVTDVDAVFIDVPEPWAMVNAAYRALKPGAHVGTLSPNIEQIQTTVEQMRETGFSRVRCLEILTRNIRVKKNLTRPYNQMVGHTGYLLFAQKINRKTP